MTPIIGLEIHVQLNTRRKMFCFDKNDPLAPHPNTHICPICLGSPGALPVPNQEAIDKVILVGLALQGRINRFSKFDRKNYFYPDLPKGYQISQYEVPLVEGGFLILPSNHKKIRLRRIHLEEDTGRLLHTPEATLVDYNRAGVPLMELVTEPDLESGQQASEFAKELQLLLRYLNVSEADMEKGQMRVEANISLPLPNPKQTQNSNDQDSRQKELSGPKVELKNLNSFKAVREAIAYEIRRQSELLKKGQPVLQETRGWDAKKGRTFSQRVKETESDYRYFPEPDIPPLKIGIRKLQQLEASLPELPAQRRERFQKEYGLPPADAQILVANLRMGEYFEAVMSEIQAWEKVTQGHKQAAQIHQKELVRLAANYLINELPQVAGGAVDWDEPAITPENFAEFVSQVHQGRVSSFGAKKLLKAMYERGGEPDHLIQELDLEQVSGEAELQQAVQAVIQENPRAVQDYQQGRENALQFLVGQVMAHTKGRANPEKVQELLKEFLSGN